MGSLTAHLLETGDHGRFGFHPRCPVCRHERLLGSLSKEPVISRRAQAALASGVLALSATAPVSAIAQESDLQQEGGSVVAPTDQPTGVESDDPGFEPGGETALPLEVAPSPAPLAPPAGEDPGPDEGIVLESEPTEDPDARLVPQTEPEIAPTPDESDTAVPPVEPISPTPSPDHPMPPLGQDPSAVEAPAEDLEAPESSEPEARAEPKPGSPALERSPDAVTEHRARGETSDTPQPSVPAQPPGPSDGGPPGVVPQPQSPAATGPAGAASDPVLVASAADGGNGDSSSPLAKGARTHVVQPGDSLWSIAARLLGRQASPAQIAREVNRLWSLNEDRIGTGDPDLLMVGAKLRLR